jgi:Lrp/AsnC family transcriptional regulator for asnA, asnC and gidA
MKLDKIDLTLLRGLEKDARTKFSDIARKCDVSVDTIIKRYKKLEKAGIIKRTTILLDPRYFGTDCIASLEIDVDPPTVIDTLAALDNENGIIFSTQAVGRHDIFAIAMKKDMGEMNRLREHIRSLPNVNEVKTSIWVDQFLLCPQNFELEPLQETEK